MRSHVAGTLAAALAVAFALGPMLLFAPATSQADTGQYTLELTTPATSVAIGSTFVVAVAVLHDNSVGAYTAVQWSVNYNSVVVQFASATRDAQAPSECFSNSDNGTRTLLGCISLAGPTMTYSGVAWDLSYTCISKGSTTFTVETSATKSFVKIDANAQPLQTHNSSSVTCADAADVPTSAATNTPQSSATLPAQGTVTPSVQPGTEHTGGATTTAQTPAVVGTTSVQGTQNPPAASATALADDQTRTSIAVPTTRSLAGATATAASTNSDGGGSSHGGLWVIGGVMLAAIIIAGGAAWFMRSRRA